MIAVFTKDERDFRGMRFTPENMFIRVRNHESIAGRHFIGVLYVNRWYEGNREILDAYDCLRIRQPEIFK